MSFGSTNGVIEASHSSNGDHLEKYKGCPHLKVIVICGEPHAIKSSVMHLLIDCKRELRMQPKGVKCVYLPFYVVSFAERLAHPRDLLLPSDYRLHALDTLSRKTKFCAFMYSNPVAHRDAFFDAMAKHYKRPDALGACRSTVARSDSTRMLYDPLIKTYYEDAVEQYQSYKFVIAIENARINGYITEKLMNPALARAVPIYLGAPDIFSDGIFNPKAMIHIDDFDSYEECVKHIAKVDQDPRLYLEYLREPLFIDNKLPKYFNANYLAPFIMQTFQ